MCCCANKGCIEKACHVLKLAQLFGAYMYVLHANIVALHTDTRTVVSRYTNDQRNSDLLSSIYS